MLNFWKFLEFIWIHCEDCKIVWAYTSNYVYRMFCTAVFLGVVYGRRYVTMCIGCFVLSYLFCSTMHYFRNSYYIGSFIHTHTHLMLYLFLSWVFWSRGSLWKQPLYP
ncbi:hypothetical protein Hanom_Chr17g01581171 [Helianthus anomalus]